MRHVVLFATAAFLAAGVVPQFMSRNDAALPASAPEAASGAADLRTVTIRRGENGHYQVEAVVDGRRIPFLVDTGATAVVLRSEDAAKLGIFPPARDYIGRAHTANGTVRFAPVELNRVEVGNIVVRNVAATVLPEGALAESLLGMSFLSRLRWQQEKDRLVLEQ